MRHWNLNWNLTSTDSKQDPLDGVLNVSWMDSNRETQNCFWPICHLLRTRKHQLIDNSVFLANQNKCVCFSSFAVFKHKFISQKCLKSWQPTSWLMQAAYISENNHPPVWFSGPKQGIMGCMGCRIVPDCVSQHQRYVAQQKQRRGFLQTSWRTTPRKLLSRKQLVSSSMLHYSGNTVWNLFLHSGKD